MSIKTTHWVTRDFAIQAIKRKVAENQNDCKYRIKRMKDGRKLKEMSNSLLEDVLEEAIHNGFYNFSIVNETDFEENKTNPYPHPYLDSLNYLPDYNDVW